MNTLKRRVSKTGETRQAFNVQTKKSEIEHDLVVTKKRVWFPGRSLAELGESEGLSPVLRSLSPTRKGMLQRPRPQCVFSSYNSHWGPGRLCLLTFWDGLPRPPPPPKKKTQAKERFGTIHDHACHSKSRVHCRLRPKAWVSPAGPGRGSRVGEGRPSLPR